MAVTQELWGSETSKAVDNFPVSGERIPVPVVRWLGRIKAAAARVKNGGGQILHDPHEVPGGSWIVNCSDPQGAAFALLGPHR